MKLKATILNPVDFFGVTLELHGVQKSKEFWLTADEDGDVYVQLSSPNSTDRCFWLSDEEHYVGAVEFDEGEDWKECIQKYGSFDGEVTKL